MPIGDLLAEISGKPSGPSSIAPVRRPLVPKRKAEDHARNATASKVPRTSDADAPVPAARQSNLPTSASASAIVPSATSAVPRPPPRPRISSPSAKSDAHAAKPRLDTVISGRVTKSSPKPSPAASSAGVAAASTGPLKGSFAEIMARAHKAQEVMGRVGAIQHKPAENMFKTRKEVKSGPRMKPKAGADMARGGSSNGTSATSNGTYDATRKNGRGRAGNGKKSPPEPEKPRIKKAALATTGYTGTARPKTPATSSKPNSDNNRRQQPDALARVGILDPRSSRQITSSSRSRREGSRNEYEDDDGMDDFIDYDDEEEENMDRGRQAPGRRRYEDSASEGESDMEADYDELEDEEEQSLRIAKREDVIELKLEQELKMAKEARKRQELKNRR